MPLGCQWAKPQASWDASKLLNICHRSLCVCCLQLGVCNCRLASDKRLPDRSWMLVRDLLGTSRSVSFAIISHQTDLLLNNPFDLMSYWLLCGATNFGWVKVKRWPIVMRICETQLMTEMAHDHNKPPSQTSPSCITLLSLTMKLQPPFPSDYECHLNAINEFVSNWSTSLYLTAFPVSALFSFVSVYLYYSVILLIRNWLVQHWCRTVSSIYWSIVSHVFFSGCFSYKQPHPIEINSCCLSHPWS